MGTKVNFHNYKNNKKCYKLLGYRKAFSECINGVTKSCSYFCHDGKLSSSLCSLGGTKNNHIIVIAHITAHISIPSFFQQNKCLRILVKNLASY